MDLGNRGYGAPVLAVCGFSGSGKTTLLEQVIPVLRSRGLAVGLVKHDARGIVSLDDCLAELASDHDLVLVEGHKATPLPKVWLGNSQSSTAPEDATEVLAELPWDSDRAGRFVHMVDDWLPRAWADQPLFAGMLVGGKSIRMGRPKQLIPVGGASMGEIIVRALGEGLTGPGASGTTGKVVLLGCGELPAALDGLPRLPDPPGLLGPLAGLIAAHRWAPRTAWIVAACDHPWLAAEDIRWLAGQRAPGRWAVVPRQPDGHPCPTLALYEPQALTVFERALLDSEHGHVRLAAVLDHANCVSPQPEPQSRGWRNVNNPDDLKEIRSS